MTEETSVQTAYPSPRLYRITLEMNQFEQQIECEFKTNGYERHQQIESVDLIDLTDDCFYALFGWLLLEDIISMSKTCKRIERVAGDHFQREYSTKSMIISSHLDKIQVSEKNEFFAKNIRNVHVYGQDAAYLFSISNCNQNIKSIGFHSMDLEKLDKRCILRLENVETVLLRGCSLSTTIYDLILKNCQKLNHLIINNVNIQDDVTNTWMHMSYPTLEYLEAVFSFNSNQTDLFKVFLLLNPNIKRLAFVPAKEFVVKCAVDAINLDTLYLAIYEKSEFELIYKSLSNLEDRGGFKRLELNFVGTYRHEFIKQLQNGLELLRSLKGLHLHQNQSHRSIGGILHSMVISNLVHLDILQCDNFGNGSIASEVAKKLPNLEELHVHKPGVATIAPFVRYSVKLKKILMPNGVISFTQSNFCDFNDERNNLLGACQLFIYVNTSLVLSKRRTYAIKPIKDLVRIVYVNFAKNHFTVKNPFIKYSIVKD